HPLGLLRIRCQRPRRRAAEEGDELAAVHSITSSASASRDRGTSMPMRLFYSFPNQHVDANPAVRVARKRGSCQSYTITISFDGSDLFRPCPIFIPRDVDRMFDSPSIKLVRATIGGRGAE